MPAARRVALVAGVACMPLTGACNLLFSVDGYVGDGDAQGTVTDGGTRPMLDAPGATDTSTMSDAGAGDAFCNGAIFCDEFDRPASDVQGAWGSINAGGGSITLVDSGPSGHALDCQVTAGASGAMVYLDEKTSISVTKATIQYGVSLAAIPAGGGIHVNELVFNTSTTASTVFAYVQGGGGLVISELICVFVDGYSCNYSQSMASVPFSPGNWHTISLTVDFGSTPAKYTAVVDGTGNIASQSSYGATPGTVEIHGGATVDPNVGAVDLMVDELLVTGQ
jgi:hypothetical protein